MATITTYSTVSRARVPIRAAYVCSSCGQANFAAPGVLSVSASSSSSPFNGEKTRQWQREEAAESLYSTLEHASDQIRERDFRGLWIECPCCLCGKDPIWSKYPELPSEDRKKAEKGIVPFLFGLIFLPILLKLILTSKGELEDIFGVVVFFLIALSALLVFGFVKLLPMFRFYAERAKLNKAIRALPETQLPTITLLKEPKKIAEEARTYDPLQIAKDSLARLSGMHRADAGNRRTEPPRPENKQPGNPQPENKRIEDEQPENQRPGGAEPEAGDPEQAAHREAVMRYLSEMTDLSDLEGFDFEWEYTEGYEFIRKFGLTPHPDEPDRDRAVYLAKCIERFRRDKPLRERRDSAVKGEPDTVLGDKDILLGELIAGYRDSSPLMIRADDVRFDSLERKVCYRAVIPNGPQGVCSFPVPEEIRTVGELLNYMEQSKGFALK